MIAEEHRIGGYAAESKTGVEAKPCLLMCPREVDLVLL